MFIWLTTRDNSADLTEMTPQGFSFFQKPRAQKSGGGVGLFISSAHKLTSISPPTQTKFQSIPGKLEWDQFHLNSLHIYRPPGPATTFFNEFQGLSSNMALLPDDLVLMGDFNLSTDSSLLDVRQPTGILESSSKSIHEFRYPYSWSWTFMVMLLI